MTIGENLRKLRKKARLSQDALAEKSGVSQQLISQIERDVNDTTKRLPELAAALEVTVEKIDPNYAEGAASASEEKAELLRIYDSLEDYPEDQELFLEQARLLQKRVRPKATPSTPTPANGSK